MDREVVEVEAKESVNLKVFDLRKNSNTGLQDQRW